MAGCKGILVTITKTEGSTPREEGAQIWVDMQSVLGSVGGGRLEAKAIEHARFMLSREIKHDEKEITLGPESGQCCGGRVELKFCSSKRPDADQKHLAIFGAGHVGSHLARLAEAIGFEVLLFDPRPQIEIEHPHDYIFTKRPETKIPELPSKTNIVILTHDHALDFKLAELALLRDDLGFIGMIGSKTKANRFRSQYRALGARLDRLQSPIAKNADDKRPEAIALSLLGEVFHKA